jgi:2-phospho-L-lactate guanylyltransferase
LVPVKRFAAAKERLAGELAPAARAELARRLADGVVASTADWTVVVVCDDHEVRRWAEAAGHRVAWTPGLDLNHAVAAARDDVAAGDATSVCVAHADLPFPHDLPAVLDRAEPGRAVIVPDRHRDGTNVVVIPATVDWRFSYGPGSFARHVAEAERLGLEVDVVEHPGLAWDVDHPEDLRPPPELGPPPWDLAELGAHRDG